MTKAKNIHHNPRPHHDLHHHVAKSVVHEQRRQLPRPNGFMINDVFRPVKSAPVEVDIVEIDVVTVTPIVFEPAPMTRSIESLSASEKELAVERAFKSAYRQRRSESRFARVLPSRVVAIFVR